MDDKRRLILDQALALVDERGLAAMSMRAVAERVGLTSMALYPYVGGKDALLDGLVDLLHLELGTAYGDDPADIDWRHRLRALGRAVRALARAHPGAFPLLLNRPRGRRLRLLADRRAARHPARRRGAGRTRCPRLARMICAFLLGYTDRRGHRRPAGRRGRPGTDDERGAEFDDDLDDLVRLVEVAVRVG